MGILTGNRNVPGQHPPEIEGLWLAGITPFVHGVTYHAVRKKSQRLLQLTDLLPDLLCRLFLKGFLSLVRIIATPVIKTPDKPGDRALSQRGPERQTPHVSTTGTLSKYPAGQPPLPGTTLRHSGTFIPWPNTHARTPGPGCPCPLSLQAGTHRRD